MAEDLEEDFEEGEGEEDSGEPAPAKSGGGGKRLILLIVLPILLVIGLAAGAYFSGIADPLLNMFSGGGEKEEQPPPPPTGGVMAAIFYDLPEMLVNLNTAGRRQNFLKIRVSLELTDPLDVPKVEAVLPRIVDNFQVYLRELRMEDLQGAAGMYRLREELLTRVNAAVKPAKVSDVLFKEMLVQ
ncbi:MAG: flagellar basal body-associated FliL family protein [Alphaproteobacteria bacterium]|nr:flagellar basal body-associated FliL family protein [Alphaproteobacteria bacterium]